MVLGWVFQFFPPKMAISEVFTTPQVSPAERRFVVFTSHGDGQLPQGLGGGALLRVLFGGAGATGEGTPQHGDLGRDGDGWGEKTLYSLVLYYICIMYICMYIYIRIYIWEFCIGKWRIYWKTMWEMILLTQGMEWANRFSDHEKTWETHVYFDDGWWMVGMGLAERTSNDKTGMLGNIVGGLEWRLVCQWHGIRCRVLWLGEPICDTVRSSSHLLFFWFLDAQNCTSPVFVNMFPHFSHTFPQFPPTTFPIFGGWFLSHLWRTRAPPLCWRSLPASSPPGGSCHV